MRIVPQYYTGLNSLFDSLTRCHCHLFLYNSNSLKNNHSSIIDILKYAYGSINTNIIKVREWDNTACRFFQKQRKDRKGKERIVYTHVTERSSWQFLALFWRSPKYQLHMLIRRFYVERGSFGCCFTSISMQSSLRGVLVRLNLPV